ncbi:hypothetical protein MYP_2380 [Sporocytophaga myxococcoides]|uniref:Uncharacterized protein n=1 Tax=Sporocytophaga myxococcoides TaxID=153721 RepID=A0A098LDS9_9BACT|nr:hypothetical protein [Sporocytophaga myxococcoides]GAL85151.1 hypothetical protein MYP_2380 [Sporocytophaga myxococcoides]
MDFIPKEDKLLIQWLRNYSLHLTSVGATLGITPAEIASLNALIFDVTTDLIQGRYKDENDKKDIMLKFLIKMINKMKSHPLYNEYEHGKKMGFA